jgi:thiamine-phosphate pyrophosphorylase
MDPRALTLIAITDGMPDGADALLDRAAAAVRGGATMLQLRLKDVDPRTQVEVARRLVALSDVPVIVNDRADIARLAHADGVHVGQDDTPVAEARRLIGDDRLIGLSIEAPEQLDAIDGADHLGVGAVFGTPTKPDATVTGLQLAADATTRAAVPVFAIGGIDETNVEDVVRAGVRRIAVVRAIRDAEDPEIAARRLRAYLER